MLRLIVLVLILANAGYYAWTSGRWIDYGFAPLEQTEPQRLAQQINPQALRVVTAQDGLASQQAAAPTTSPTKCLQVGIFNEEQTAVLRDRLTSALPAGAWVLEAAQEPARWLVYMGKYSSPDAVIKKQSQLRGLGVSFEALNSPALEPGISLGSFTNKAEAELALTKVAPKGVKTAKVVQDRVELRGQRLKLAAVDPALSSLLETITPQLAGKTFKPCG